MTSRQYKHQQDRIQQGWSKVHVMLDPGTTKTLKKIQEECGLNRTEAIGRAIRCWWDDYGS